MDGLLFGSIGTVAETSERQREAFNAAFAEGGIDLTWDVAAYRRMLAKSGGANRIREQAAAAGLDLSDEQVAALHRRKTEIFDKDMIDRPLTPRPGVVRLLGDARAAGLPTAFVTTTARANVDAMLASLSGSLGPQMFDLIVTREMVSAGKPDPECYHVAAERLDLVSPVIIEDTAPSLRAALASNFTAIATPGAYATDQDFTGARLVAADLDHAPDQPEGRVTLDVLRALG